MVLILVWHSQRPDHGETYGSHEESLSALGVGWPREVLWGVPAMKSTHPKEEYVTVNGGRPCSDLHTLAGLVGGERKPDLISTDQWPAIETLALQHGLGPMLDRVLKQSDMPAREALTRATLRSARHFTLQDTARKEINAELSRAGIQAIWLKGAAWAGTLYPDPILRPMGDLDVLVPYDQARAALDRLLAMGYRFAALDRFNGSQHTVEPDAKSNHHYELIGGPSDGVAVEIHFRLLAQNDAMLPLNQVDWFRKHTTEQRFEDGTTGTVLEPEADLLYLAAHAMIQHGESEKLRNFLDLHLLIQKRNPDWAMVIDKAVELGWAGAVARALCRARDYFGTPVPEPVFDELIRRRSAHESHATVLEMEGAGLRWERAKGTLSGMSPAGKLKYVWGSLFPAGAYMRRKYGAYAERPLWWLYLYRWRDQAGDVWAAIKRKRGRGGASLRVTSSYAKRLGVRHDSAALPSRHASAPGRADNTAHGMRTSPVDAISIPETKRIIEQLLAGKTPVHFRVGGQSMRPAVRDGERVRVRSIRAGDVRRGAVLLYRGPDRLILHRLVRMEEGMCLMAADASGRDMQSIPREDVIGAAEWVERGGRRIRLDIPFARLKGLLLYYLRPVRRIRHIAVSCPVSFRTTTTATTTDDERE